jgi:hypothetical protein
MAGEISLGRATSNTITGHTTPGEVVADIQSGKWAKQIAALRAVTGDEADRLKRNLLGILWTGTFTSRKSDDIEKFSGYLCADIDKIPDRIGELRDTALQDPHATTAFISPSGTGIKIVFRVPVATDARQHQQNFNAVRIHVATHYNAKVDEAAKDVARLCFVSHDPAAFYNPAAVPLAVQSEPATVASVQPFGAEKGGRNNAAFELACQCRDKGQTPDETRAAVRDFAAKCNPPLPEVEADGCVKSAFSQPPRLPRIDIAARLAVVRFDIHVPPPLETAVFKLTTGTTTHTRGNISAITAQAKAGKTAFNAALIAAGITDRPDDCDGLGFRAVNPDGLPILLFDTEHSPEHHWKLCDRIFRRAMLTESGRLHAYRLAVFTVKELNAALAYLLTERKWHSVFLDGTGDFVSDVNDPEECNAFVSRLHGLAIEYDTHILNVLHLNPSSETKSRGHLGSQLERKSETNLRIEKKDGVSIVYSDRNRGADIPKDTAPRFVWSEEHQMHISADSIGSVKRSANLELLCSQRDEAFRVSGRTTLSWGEITNALKKVPGIKSDSKAARTLRELKSGGLVVQNLQKQYVKP